MIQKIAVWCSGHWCRFPEGEAAQFFNNCCHVLHLDSNDSAELIHSIVSDFIRNECSKPCEHQ